VYVAHGPYRFLRHPIYWGMTISAFGQMLLTAGDMRGLILYGWHGCLRSGPRPGGVALLGRTNQQRSTVSTVKNTAFFLPLAARRRRFSADLVGKKSGKGIKGREPDGSGEFLPLLPGGSCRRSIRRTEAPDAGDDASVVIHQAAKLAGVALRPGERGSWDMCLLSRVIRSQL
jgi:hypothetical protein